MLEAAEAYIKNMETPVGIITYMLFAQMLGIAWTLLQFSPSSHQFSQKISALRFFNVWNTLRSIHNETRTIHLPSSTRTKTLKLQLNPSFYQPRPHLPSLPLTKKISILNVRFVIFINIVVFLFCLFRP